MDKIDKLNKINELKQQQLKLMEKSIKIATLPTPKRPSTSIKRAFRVLALAWECKMIQEQIKLITWQPIPPPNLEKGGIIIEGKAHGKEEIIINHKNIKPCDG